MISNRSVKTLGNNNIRFKRSIARPEEKVISKFCLKDYQDFVEHRGGKRSHQLCNLKSYKQYMQSVLPKKNLKTVQ